MYYLYHWSYYWPAPRLPAVCAARNRGGSIGADACECVFGTYNKSSTGRCEACPKGMTCPGAQTRPRLRLQYWASSGSIHIHV